MTQDHHSPRLQSAWDALWNRLGVMQAPSQRPVLAELLERYAEPHRVYHGVAHLRDVLTEFDQARSAELARRPDEVELALWFHDAIYDPRRSDNELKSADLVRRAASDAGVAEQSCERVHALVMATDHRAVPADADAQLICDVDLAILGADAARFDEYERQIRAEYAWVPDPAFRARRIEILEALIARRAIFSTVHFQERFEARARANLSRSLTVLRG
jgi:predicted metal-dependent HD superfamily phosphohydrolase